jgi:hypothetical protein
MSELGVIIDQSLVSIDSDSQFSVVDHGRYLEIRSVKPIVVAIPDLRVVSDGSIDVISRGDQHALTGGIHHTNPGGGQYYDSAMSRDGDPPWIRELMVERDATYRDRAAAHARREFYIRAARQALMPKLRKTNSRAEACQCHLHRRKR